MKTLRILGMILIAGFLFSREKDIERDQIKTDVVFGIDQLDLNELKSDAIIPCHVDADGNLIEPEWAEIVINGVTYEPLVFYLNNKLYTQAIKLPTKTDYEITKFVLKAMVDNIPTIVMATPEIDSDFEFYVDKPIAFTFDVPEFDKVEVDIEVLCFQPSMHEQFGFFWFNITEIVVREICFFGDLCVKNPMEYVGSRYEDVFNLQDYPFDLPAIFQIHAYQKVDGEWEKYDEFTNIGLDEDDNWEYLGTTCARYPDRPDRVDEFKFVLKVLVKVGDGFEYVEFYDGWVFPSDDPLVTIEDNQKVVNFVIGSCAYGDFIYPDLKLPPYQNLPEKANINISITTNNPYANGAYWAITVNSLDPHNGDFYDFPPPSNSDIYLGWCGDAATTINQGTNITFFIYSSLNDANWPDDMPVSVEDLAKVNWLFNNLPEGYPELTGMFVIEGEFSPTPEQGKELQHAIWKILGQTPPGNVVGGDNFPYGNAAAIAGTASDKGDFVPMPGGYAAVLMVKADAQGNPKADEFQLIFTVVDP